MQSQRCCLCHVWYWQKLVGKQAQNVAHCVSADVTSDMTKTLVLRPDEDIRVQDQDAKNTPQDRLTTNSCLKTSHP